MTFIKICGITNLEDALMAVEAGADALGFNFYRPSPRYVEPIVAREIIEQLPKSIMTVGVFVNEPELENIAKAAKVEALQLHGDETPEHCASLKSWYVIKVLAVNDNFDVNLVNKFDVNAVMLDTAHKSLRGGTGKVFDWSIAGQVNESGVRMFLAGGLSPENVVAAIQTVRPYAVDACSGIESAPGKKDPQRLRAFVSAVRGNI
ncbi:MAG TPA: phosphoribosylanthranilate isomerase [Pyrinomonadaceae bacterium]